MAEVKVAGWKGLREVYGDSVKVKRIDTKNARLRIEQIMEVLEKFEPKLHKEPTEEMPGIIVVEKDDTAIFIAVYSDNMVVLARDILDVLEDVISYKHEKEMKALLIIYSRKGRLGPLCYLFLGGVIRDQEIGVLYVNGSPDEVYEVVRDILEKGEYEVKEEDSISLSKV